MTLKAARDMYLVLTSLVMLRVNTAQFWRVSSKT